MAIQLILFWAAIIAGFIMAWGIGANDVSNAMGTSVGSKAITIRQAVIIAAIFEFLGAFLAGSEVTTTIRQSIINPIELTDSPNIFILGMLSSLLSAGTWLLLASFLGLPVSTTHSIVGAIIGFGITILGFYAIKWSTVLSIILGWVISPILGAIIAYVLFISAQIFIFNKPHPTDAAKKIVPIYILIASWVIFMIVCTKLHHLGIRFTTLKCIALATFLSITTALIGKLIINKVELNSNTRPRSHYYYVEKIFAILMVFTACAMAFAHGSNDVANAIGPVAAIISVIQEGGIVETSHVNWWVLMLGASGIVIGLAMYGHKVIATVGSKITQLTPSRGFSATIAAAITVVFASSTGLPISTTHTLVGGILGVGLARGIHALNISVVKSIFVSWIVTLPAGAVLAVIFFYVLRLFF